MAAVSLRPFPSIPHATESTAHGVEICRTSVAFEGKSREILIKAYVDARGAFYASHSCMVFEVEWVKSPGFDIGRFNIMRVWDQADRSGRVAINPHYDGDELEAGTSLSHRRLLVLGMKDFLGKDRLTGACPLSEVLVQLAVEILDRESDPELDIEATPMNRAFNADTLFTSGFVQKTTLLLGQPVGLQGILHKNLNGQTSRFEVPVQHGLAVPALVAFAANRTWEQVIKARPILNFAPGPVMPIFQASQNSVNSHA